MDNLQESTSAATITVDPNVYMQRLRKEVLEPAMKSRRDSALFDQVPAPQTNMQVALGIFGGFDQAVDREGISVDEAGLKKQSLRDGFLDMVIQDSLEKDDAVFLLQVLRQDVSIYSREGIQSALQLISGQNKKALNTAKKILSEEITKRDNLRSGEVAASADNLDLQGRASADLDSEEEVTPLSVKKEKFSTAISGIRRGLKNGKDEDSLIKKLTNATASALDVKRGAAISTSDILAVINNPERAAQGEKEKNLLDLSIERGFYKLAFQLVAAEAKPNALLTGSAATEVASSNAPDASFTGAIINQMKKDRESYSKSLLRPSLASKWNPIAKSREKAQRDISWQNIAKELAYQAKFDDACKLLKKVAEQAVAADQELSSALTWAIENNCSDFFAGLVDALEYSDVAAIKVAKLEIDKKIELLQRSRDQKDRDTVEGWQNVAADLNKKMVQIKLSELDKLLAGKDLQAALAAIKAMPNGGPLHDSLEIGADCCERVLERIKAAIDPAHLKEVLDLQAGTPPRTVFEALVGSKRYAQAKVLLDAGATILQYIGLELGAVSGILESKYEKVVDFNPNKTKNAQERDDQDDAMIDLMEVVLQDLDKKDAEDVAAVNKVTRRNDFLIMVAKSVANHIDPVILLKVLQKDFEYDVATVAEVRAALSTISKKGQWQEINEVLEVKTKKAPIPVLTGDAAAANAAMVRVAESDPAVFLQNLQEKLRLIDVDQKLVSEGERYVKELEAKTLNPLARIAKTKKIADTSTTIERSKAEIKEKTDDLSAYIAINRDNLSLDSGVFHSLLNQGKVDAVANLLLNTGLMQLPQMKTAAMQKDANGHNILQALAAQGKFETVAKLLEDVDLINNNPQLLIDSTNTVLGCLFLGLDTALGGAIKNGHPDKDKIKRVLSQAFSPISLALNHVQARSKYNDAVYQQLFDIKTEIIGIIYSDLNGDLKNKVDLILRATTKEEKLRILGKLSATDRERVATIVDSIVAINATLGPILQNIEMRVNDGSVVGGSGALPPVLLSAPARRSPVPLPRTITPTAQDRAGGSSLSGSEFDDEEDVYGAVGTTVPGADRVNRWGYEHRRGAGQPSAASSAILGSATPAMQTESDDLDDDGNESGHDYVELISDPHHATSAAPENTAASTIAKASHLNAKAQPQSPDSSSDIDNLVESWYEERKLLWQKTNRLFGGAFFAKEIPLDSPESSIKSNIEALLAGYDKSAKVSFLQLVAQKAIEYKDPHILHEILKDPQIYGDDSLRVAQALREKLQAMPKKGLWQEIDNTLKAEIARKIGVSSGDRVPARLPLVADEAAVPALAPAPALVTAPASPAPAVVVDTAAESAVAPPSTAPNSARRPVVNFPPPPPLQKPVLPSHHHHQFNQDGLLPHQPQMLNQGQQTLPDQLTPQQPDLLRRVPSRQLQPPSSLGEIGQPSLLKRSLFPMAMPDDDSSSQDGDPESHNPPQISETYDQILERRAENLAPQIQLLAHFLSALEKTYRIAVNKDGSLRQEGVKQVWEAEYTDSDGSSKPLTRLDSYLSDEEKSALTYFYPQSTIAASNPLYMSTYYGQAEGGGEHHVFADQAPPFTQEQPRSRRQTQVFAPPSTIPNQMLIYFTNPQTLTQIKDWAQQKSYDFENELRAEKQRGATDDKPSTTLVATTAKKLEAISAALNKKASPRQY